MVSRCGIAYIGEGNVVGVGTLMIGRVGDDVGPPLARSIGAATPTSLGYTASGPTHEHMSCVNTALGTVRDTMFLLLMDVLMHYLTHPFSIVVECHPVLH